MPGFEHELFHAVAEGSGADAVAVASDEDGLLALFQDEEGGGSGGR